MAATPELTRLSEELTKAQAERQAAWDDERWEDATYWRARIRELCDEVRAELVSLDTEARMIPCDHPLEDREGVNCHRCHDTGWVKAGLP